MDFDLIDKAAAEAAAHADECGKCAHPIIDAEGNPGLFGEACIDGLKLLIAYCDASHSFVPAWARYTVQKKVSS